MEAEGWPQVGAKSFDGAPCAWKLACTVRSGGKLRTRFSVVDHNNL